MQASALLLRWGSYWWACNLLVLIIYLFFLPVMLPSVLPRLTTDSAAKVFPGVWKPLLRFPFRDGSSFPGRNSLPTSFVSFFVFYIFFLLAFEDNDLLFWMPDVLCQHLEVVLWDLLGIQCSFDEFVGEKVVSPSYSSAILGPSFLSFLNLAVPGLGCGMWDLWLQHVNT